MLTSCGQVYGSCSPLDILQALVEGRVVTDKQAVATYAAYQEQVPPRRSNAGSRQVGAITEEKLAQLSLSSGLAGIKDKNLRRRRWGGWRR